MARLLIIAVGTTLLEAQCPLSWQTTSSVPGAIGGAYLNWLGGINTMADWDPDGAGPLPARIVVGGILTLAGNVVVQNIAALEPYSQLWSAAGAIPEQVFDIAANSNGTMLACGAHIYQWTGSGWNNIGTPWVSYPLSTPFAYRVVAMPNGDFLVAGRFDSIDYTPAKGIARWNGTSWQSVGNFQNNDMRQLFVMSNGDVITSGNGTPYRWDGSQWSFLGFGPSYIRAYGEDQQGLLVAAGTFYGAGDVCAWNGSTWVSLGYPGNPTDSTILTRSNGNLVVAGWFTTTASTTDRIAQWDGVSWQPIGDVNGHATDLKELPTGEIIAVGVFLDIDGTAANNIARWNGASWSAVGAGPNGPSRLVKETTNGDIVIAGDFTHLPDGAGGFGDRIAKLTGQTMTAMGLGFDAAVTSLAELPNGDLIAGGFFLNSGPIACPRLARWTGNAWQPFGGADGNVHAMAVLPSGDLVVGGFFGSIAGVPAQRVARWDGTVWHALGAGLDNGVWAMAVLPTGDLVVTGPFNNAGGQPAQHAARWNGTTWHAMPLAGQPSAMAVNANGELIAIGNGSVNRWTGSSWQPLPGTGTQLGSQSICALPGGDFAISGYLSQSSNLCRWNGSAWSSLMPIVPGNINGLTMSSTGELIVVGDFQTWGGMAPGSTSSPYIARLTTPCTASASSALPGCSGSGGINLLTPSSMPWLGSTSRAIATGMPTTGVGLGVLGFNATAIALANLLPQGGSGCVLWSQPDHVSILPITNGRTEARLIVPNSALLVGAQVQQQVIACEIDPQGNLLAVTATNSLVHTLGKF
jgi:hypothetical protein